MTKHPQALKVVIADDETPARSRVRDLLEDCASSFPIELVGEAASGRELLALLGQTPADVVLLDIRMPEMDGLEAAQHLLKLPGTAVGDFHDGVQRPRAKGIRAACSGLSGQADPVAAPARRPDESAGDHAAAPRCPAENRARAAQPSVSRRSAARSC